MTIEIKPELLQKIITHLIHSDGMEVTYTTNDYLIKQKIDNVSLIETLEKQLFQYYFQKIQIQKKKNPSIQEIYDVYSPLYINADKYYKELLKENTPGIITETHPVKQTKLTDY